MQKEITLKRGYNCQIKEEQTDTTKIDIIGNYSKSNYDQTSIVGKNGVAPCVTENHGQVTAIVVNEPKQNECVLLGGIGEKDSNNNTQWKYQNRIYSSKNSMPSIATGFNPYVDDPIKDKLKELVDVEKEEKKEEKEELRIRKLTPTECLRLMNVKQEDINLMSEHQTNATLYHLAGDSICSNVLMAIFGELLDVSWEEKFKEIEQRYKKR